MAHKVFPIPNFSGTAVDLIWCNSSDPNANGVVHYAFTIGAEKDAVSKRTLPWAKLWEFAGEYGKRHPETIERLKAGTGYRPGEGILDSEDGPSFESNHDTIMRLGALELLANLSSGRLSTTDKDPFPHQLALQQYMRKPPHRAGVRRILVADEVGLGKTIEAGLILRDILLAHGQLEGFRCLYLTSGGLVEDAAEKLRDVLSGIIDGNQIVDTVASFREYGVGNTLGVRVASMHAARRYASENLKKQLPVGIRPEIVIIDECHHAASEGDLAGTMIRRQVATQTYITAKQLLSGEFWLNSEPPKLGILMSATPFRSGAQFVNLLRLLTHGVERPGKSKVDAFKANMQATELRSILQDEQSSASVVWRQQDDDGVRSWSGNRIFPNLTVRRPHHDYEFDPSTPRLSQPSGKFLELLSLVKEAVVTIARAHSQSFGGFAIAQLEKKLTSSSVAGACWLFSWAVRHCQWNTLAEFNNDKRQGIECLRKLIRRISQRIAAFTRQEHETVRFPSDGFEFPARSLSKGGNIEDIYKYSDKMREDGEETGLWVADQSEVTLLVNLGEQLLDLGTSDGDRVAVEDAKLAWLNELLQRYPDDRFLLFTESLQTCEVLQGALGSACRTLVGSKSKAERNQAVADLRNPRMKARVLIATSAADEGFDLQVASKVIHWDLSSSPATLMQRNGRVARLGQKTDVIAYYLILSGTHEERRDSALQAKFAELGIDDEAIKNRILGTLTEDEEARLEQAIEDNEVRVVGDVLRKAANDNQRMDEELADIRKPLQYAQVLNREDLADRLGVWQSMGLPDAAVDGIKFQFDSIKWSRPVFAEVSRTEEAESRIAHIQNGDTKQSLVFDPEFLVFGSNESGVRLQLAGIPPWKKDTTKHGRHRIVPYKKDDLLGTLFHGVARLQRADFLAVSRMHLTSELQLAKEACWLLFCTHPLREIENVLPLKPRPYLTYYSFSQLVEGVAAMPLDVEGAEAAAVHKFLCHAERLAIDEALSELTAPDQIQSAKIAGEILQAWTEAVTRFGAASFLEEEKYFVPIPVALVQIVD